MDEPDALASNAAVWSHYLRSEIRFWIDPLGLLRPSSIGEQLADANASRIAGSLSLIAAPTFARLYNNRATAGTGEGAARVP